MSKRYIYFRMLIFINFKQKIRILNEFPKKEINVYKFYIKMFLFTLKKELKNNYFLVSFIN